MWLGQTLKRIWLIIKLVVLPDAISHHKRICQCRGMESAFRTNQNLVAIDNQMSRRAESVLFCHEAKGVTEPPHQSPKLLGWELGTTDLEGAGIQCLERAASRQCKKHKGIASYCTPHAAYP